MPPHCPFRAASPSALKPGCSEKWAAHIAVQPTCCASHFSSPQHPGTFLHAFCPPFFPIYVPVLPVNAGKREGATRLIHTPPPVRAMFSTYGGTKCPWAHSACTAGLQSAISLAGDSPGAAVTPFQVHLGWQATHFFATQTVMGAPRHCVGWPSATDESQITVSHTT